MTTESRQKGRKRSSQGRKRPSKAKAAALAAKAAPEPTTLAVPVGGAELAWLAAKLRDVARGWATTPHLSLIVRRDAVSGVVWGQGPVGIAAHVATSELVQAVDDLPAAGLVATLDLTALAKLTKALRREPRVMVEVTGSEAVTLRAGAGAYRVKPATVEHPRQTPLGGGGTVAKLDAGDLGKALGLAARFADPTTAHGDHVRLAAGGSTLSILAGSNLRVGRLTVGAVDLPAGEAVEAIVPSAAAKAAHAVLRQAKGSATVEVTPSLVVLTGQTKHGSLGVMIEHEADAVLDPSATRDLFAAIDTRQPSLLAQLDAKALAQALKRGAPLRHAANPGAPLTTVLTTDRHGRLLVGHVLATGHEGDDDARAHVHAEEVEAFVTGRGTVAVSPKLMAGIVPKAGPVVVDCGSPSEPIRVRAVDGALSIDVAAAPYAPDQAPNLARRLRGEPEVAPKAKRGAA